MPLPLLLPRLISLHLSVPDSLPCYVPMPLSRGLHSSTFRLNVSTFCGIRWVSDFPLVYETGEHVEV